MQLVGECLPRETTGPGCIPALQEKVIDGKAIDLWDKHARQVKQRLWDTGPRRAAFGKINLSVS